MLQPKRTKYRKQFKGRNTGLAQRGSSVAFGDELRVELGLADLRDVDAHVLHRHAEHLRDLRAELLDVLTLLADHDARTRGVNRDARGLRRTLNRDLRHAGLGKLRAQHFAHLQISREVLRVFALVRVPLRIPVLGNAEANAGGMNLVTHVISSRRPR